MGQVQTAGGNTAAAIPATITAVFGVASTSGNTVLLIVGSDNTIATPAGWTLDQSAVFNAGHYVFRKAAAGTTESTVITTGSASTDWQLIELAGLTGAPNAKTSAGTSSVGATSQATGSITPTATGNYTIYASFTTSAVRNPAPNSATYTSPFVIAPATQATSKAAGTNVGLLTTKNDVTNSSGSYNVTASNYDGAGDAAASTGIIVAYTATGGAVAPKPPVIITQQAVNRAAYF